MLSTILRICEKSSLLYLKVWEIAKSVQKFKALVGSLGVRNSSTSSIPLAKPDSKKIDAMIKALSLQ